MPYIYVNNCNKEEFEYVASQLVLKLSKIIDVETSEFHFIDSSNAMFVNGSYNKDKVVISYHGFERTADQYSEIAGVLISGLQNKFSKSVEVYFLKVDKTLCFES